MDKARALAEELTEYSLAQRRAMRRVGPLAMHQEYAPATDPVGLAEERAQPRDSTLDRLPMKVERVLGVDLAAPQLRHLRVRDARRTRGVAGTVTFDGQRDAGRHHGDAHHLRRWLHHGHAIAAIEWRCAPDGLEEQRLLLRRHRGTLTTHPFIVYPVEPAFARNLDHM